MLWIPRQRWEDIIAPALREIGGEFHNGLNWLVLWQITGFCSTGD
jgi:hypothetical protein